MSETTHRILQFEQHWIDRAASWVADQCSPILVKEARQAMKSWQFHGTFLLLLLSVVAWSFLGISTTLNEEGREESGAALLSGYMLILGFPLAVVLPLASFRSLAREFDDDTIQLLSITTLDARRVVLGKLGSAALQMVVYLSAVVPCVGFSYLLRGIDLSLIVVLLSQAIVGSLALCCLGLMLAGFARINWLATLLNLGLMVLLLFCFYLWCVLNFEFVRLGPPSNVWTNAAVVLAIFAGAGYVAFESATSLISFPSEDRSSRIRLAISWQVLVAVIAALAWGYFGYDRVVAMDKKRYELFAFLISTVISHYYCFVGAMMASEQPELSQRIRRSLPKSILGRVRHGLYLPGPGRGYLYALSGILCWNLGIFLILAWEVESLGVTSGAPVVPYTYFMPILINAVFGTIYLSLAYLFMLFFGKHIKFGRALISAIVLVLAYGFVAIACTLIDAVFVPRSYGSIGFAQRWNWPVVLNRFDMMSDSFADTAVVGGILAIGLALFCGMVAIREWVVAPVMVPKRVQEESKRRAFAQSQPASPLE